MIHAFSCVKWYAVLWKSNANKLCAFRGFSREFRLKRNLFDNLCIFAMSIVSIHVNFRAIARGVRQYAANFQVIICSTWKFEVNFQVKTHAVLCKVCCDVNKNHPSRCCVVVAWNISLITSHYSGKELKRANRKLCNTHEVIDSSKN